MANLNEVKAERGDLLALARNLVTKAKESGTDLTGETKSQYDTLLGRIKQLDADIERIEGYTAAHGVNPGSMVAGMLGVAAERSGRQTGLASSIRELYNRATSEERGQIDALGAYLTGRISASADLTPGGDGGVLIPTFVLPALERDYAAFAPVVSQARIWGTETGEPAVFPVLSDSESAVQLAPAASTGADDTVSGDTPPTDLTGPTLGAWKVSSKPVFVPRETFTDSAIDIVAEVIGALLAESSALKT